MCEINTFRHELHCYQTWVLLLRNQQYPSRELSQSRNTQIQVGTDYLMGMLWTWAHRNTILYLHDSLLTCFQWLSGLSLTSDNWLYVPKRTENKFLQNVDINTQNTKKAETTCMSVKWVMDKHVTNVSFQHNKIQPWKQRSAFKAWINLENLVKWMAETKGHIFHDFIYIKHP